MEFRYQKLFIYTNLPKFISVCLNINRSLCTVHKLVTTLLTLALKGNPLTQKSFSRPSRSVSGEYSDRGVSRCEWRYREYSDQGEKKIPFKNVTQIKRGNNAAGIKRAKMICVSQVKVKCLFGLVKNLHLWLVKIKGFQYEASHHVILGQNFIRRAQRRGLFDF